MLKDKCILFERSMNEACMTINHNTDVANSYLYLTYGGTDYDESDDFQHIKPSEQLGRLMLDSDIDYKDIINNFIKNFKESVILYNQNMEIFRMWLHDYDADTEGHEYVDLVFDMEEIAGDKTDEELEEIFDTLMEKVKREIIPINCNIEMLIERF